MKFTIALDPPAHEMACEEIRRQLAFVQGIEVVDITLDGRCIEIEVPAEIGQEALRQVDALARRIERVLRNVSRKIAFRSAVVDNPSFVTPVDLTDVNASGNGAVTLEGIPMLLFRYFDRHLESVTSHWCAETLTIPSLISREALERAGYNGSFPQHLTYLSPRFGNSVYLAPAACYHVYDLFRNRQMSGSRAFNVCGKCFRHEPEGFTDLRRLWEFTMREWVFLGLPADVRALRDQSIEMVANFLDRHKLAAEIRTASDPFFLSADSTARTYYQMKSDSKFEVSLLLPDGGRLAAGSINYHADFFGRAFQIALADGKPIHTACVAFGLERWVYGFLAQHGRNRNRWPEAVRAALEFQ